MKSDPSKAAHLLLRLAEQRFGYANDVERRTCECLCYGAADGLTSDYSGPSPDSDDLHRSETWDPIRVIQAQWINWICTDPKASKLVNYRGLIVKGAAVRGEIDLEGAEIPFGLQFVKCALPSAMTLLDTRLQMLNLNGSFIAGLKADGLRVTGSVFLADGFISTGEVRLVGASIGGALDCHEGGFIYPHGYALNAARARINGKVALGTDTCRDSLLSFRGVNLNGTTIGGNLDCSGARFFSHRDGESALDCKAFTARNARVGGNVTFAKGFASHGVADLSGAEVTGCLFWKESASAADTTLWLESTTIGVLADDSQSWPRKSHLFLDGFTYRRIDRQSPLEATERLDWLQRMSEEPVFPQPYKQLASVLQSSGYEEEALKVLIALSEARGRERTQLTWSEWFWYLGFGKVIGYGYRPLRALGVSLVLIAMGWMWAILGFDHGLIWPTDTKVIHYSETRAKGAVMVDRDYPRFSPLVYSIETFTPLLNLAQASNWRPNANRGESWGWGSWSLTQGSLLRAYFWCHTIAGWILTTLWFGAITGLVRK